MTSFQTEFAVEMTCESCVQDVNNVLKGAEGIKKFDINLKEQRVVVEGSGRLPYRGLTFYNQPFSPSAFFFPSVSHSLVASSLYVSSSIRHLKAAEEYWQDCHCSRIWRGPR